MKRLGIVKEINRWSQIPCLFLYIFNLKHFMPATFFLMKIETSKFADATHSFSDDFLKSCKKSYR